MTTKIEEIWETIDACVEAIRYWRDNAYNNWEYAFQLGYSLAMIQSNAEELDKLHARLADLYEKEESE